MLLESCHILRAFSSLGLPPKTVVLTFDDGPNPHGQTTSNLLDMLRQHQVRACFNPIGEQVARCPALVRRIAAAGHLIANHSYTHPFPLGVIRWLPDQIDPTDRAIGEALGISDYHSHFFRPPHGLLTPALHAVMRQRELRLLPVSYFIHDSAYSPATAHRVVDSLLARLRRDAGGIIVLHDGRCRRPFGLGKGDPASPHSGANRSWVPGAVDTLITTLRPEGFHFDIAAIEQMQA